MPNNMKQPDNGKKMTERNDRGEFMKYKDRGAPNPSDDKGYGKDKGMDRQGSGSQSSGHMSELGKKGGQH